MSFRLEFLLVISVLVFAGPSSAQELPVSDPEIVHENTRVSVPRLAEIKSADGTSSEIAKAAVATVLSASNVKCDSASQLNVLVEANAESPLKTLAEKLAGASCMTNGTIVHLGAEFTPNESIHADDIIAPIVAGKPLLIRWNGIVYVLYGVIYDEHIHNSGKRENVIRQLLLLDPRYAGERRRVVFHREKDDFAHVEGIAEIRFLSP